MRLSGKVAIITGAGSGIGRASAVLFAREGARLVLSGRRKEALEETLRLIRRERGEACSVPGDVSKAETAEKLVEQALTRFGKIDILFNNAGVGYSSPYIMSSVINIPEADWEAVLDINLKSVFLTTKAAIPHMLKNGGGSIVNCSSINGVIGCGADAYSASKGGINALSRALAVEYGKNNIRVNVVSPGPTETPMIEKALQEKQFNEYWSNASPMKRIARPEEVAYAALFLASDEASFITGQNLLVDGGLTIS
jgi:NAD(P)-dependent dehydrogenase (short-subunit alcohol dehydrogenase family)